MKSKIINDTLRPLKKLYADNRKTKGTISEKTKSAQKIGKKWQERLKSDPKFSIEVSISNDSKEKIDVVDTDNGIAYELKVSGKNVKHEFYKDAFKVLVYNEKNKDEAVSTFVFISEKDGINRLEKSVLYKEVLNIIKNYYPVLQIDLRGV